MFTCRPTKDKTVEETRSCFYVHLTLIQTCFGYSVRKMLWRIRQMKRQLVENLRWTELGPSKGQTLFCKFCLATGFRELKFASILCTVRPERYDLNQL